MVKLFKKMISIVKGTWRNIFHKNNTLAEARLRICRCCDDYVVISKRMHVCHECGCVLESKARVAEEKCDKGKW